jgi:hypothetical protein
MDVDKKWSIVDSTEMMPYAIFSRDGSFIVNQI